MKKLKHYSIKIHPMTEKPTKTFQYVLDNGFLTVPYSDDSFSGDRDDAIGWIAGKIEVIDEITFDELEVGKPFSADFKDGKRYYYIKGSDIIAYGCYHEGRIVFYKHELTNIKRLKEDN